MSLKRKIEYTNVSSPDLFVLTQVVDRMLQEGWEVVGGLVTESKLIFSSDQRVIGQQITYFQTMTRTALPLDSFVASELYSEGRDAYAPRRG